MSGLRISPPADEKAKLDVEVDYVYNQVSQAERQGMLIEACCYPILSDCYRSWKPRPQEL